MNTPNNAPQLPERKEIPILLGDIALKLPQPVPAPMPPASEIPEIPENIVLGYN